MFPIIIEVAISLVVIFFLMSTLVSFIYEIIALVFSSRGKVLKNSLKLLLNENKKGAGIIDSMYESAHIYKLRIFKKLNRSQYLPAHISPESFANALFEHINGGHLTEEISQFKQKVLLIKNNFLQQKLLTLIAELDTGKQNMAGIKENIMKWFDDYMKTVTEVYKLRSKVIVCILSAIICVGMNLDTITLTEYFWKNKEKREMMVGFAERLNEEAFKLDSLQAKNVIDTNKSSTNRIAVTNDQRIKRILAENKKIMDTLNKFELPIYAKQYTIETSQIKGFEWGWYILIKLFGLSITTFCLTLGAPYWYQMMQNLIQVKKTITNGKS